MDHSSHNMDHADHNMHANNAEENLDDVLDSTDKPTGHENHSAGGHVSFNYFLRLKYQGLNILKINQINKFKSDIRKFIYLKCGFCLKIFKKNILYPREKDK